MKNEKCGDRNYPHQQHFTFSILHFTFASNAQLELKSTGDFIARSNEVEYVYRRIEPFDWDGDGLPNEDDADPWSYDAEGGQYVPTNEIPDPATSNCYCSIDVRVNGRRSLVTFEGVGSSDYPDPKFIAEPDRTYDVKLLIGKTYRVNSSAPISIVGKSSDDISVFDVGPNTFTAVWPVSISMIETGSQGIDPFGGAGNPETSAFRIEVVPDWLGGGVVWTNGVCCPIRGEGLNFTFSCDGSCGCGGCSALGQYRYCGFSLPVNGGHCGCETNRVDDGVHAGLEEFGFDKAAAIYENVYTNMPGVVVHPASSNVILRCVVQGGQSGGLLSVALNGTGLQKLEKVGGDNLPNVAMVAPGERRVLETMYAPREPSGLANDIEATVTFVEGDLLGTIHSGTSRLTSVRVELRPNDLPPENPAPNRHILGIGEKATLFYEPSDMNFRWTGGDGLNINSDSDLFFCPWTGGVYVVSAKVGNACYDIPFTVLEPVVDCRQVEWNSELDTNATVGVSGWVGMKFSLYVLPRTVSFEWIYMEEVPVAVSYAIPATGYFTLKSEVLHPTHGVTSGAGIWSQPQLSDGSWTHDKAQMPRSCPPVTEGDRPQWAEGTMRWAIPVGCGGIDRVVRRVLDPDPTDQVYEMEADGTLTIRKYGHFIRRDTSGRVWLDGNRVNAWWNPWFD